MKLTISAALVCLLLAHPAAAESTEALARQYVEIPAVQATILDMYSAKALGGMVSASIPDGVEISPAKKAAVGELFSQRLTKLRPMMEAAMIDAAVQAYTAEEIKAMIAFAESPAGASSIRKRAAFMESYTGQTMPEIMRALSEVRPEMMRILMN